MPSLRLVGLAVFCALFWRISVAYAFLGAAIDSSFLHINNVTVDCLKDRNKHMPYRDAIAECANDAQCCFVVVEEFDAHLEDYGRSRLCYSCTLSGPRAMENARISIKGERLIGNASEDFDIRLNRQAICERGQLLGSMEPVISFSNAAKECDRTNCDYFTMSTLEGVPDYPGNVNKAWFCSGTSKSVPQDGFITVTRKKRNTEF
ncbi:hypothetical protein X943_003683 [Babesia divergens]|uniref:Uncharacterized protein n=1 Tax=Babesia divergens TaxID=32595 RepID=A0AAD9GDL7_BABDI|nr:hypothetical protein X943_003683 [Babesia divergens]